MDRFMIMIKPLHPKIQMMCSIEEYGFCVEDFYRKWFGVFLENDMMIMNFIEDMQRCISMYIVKVIVKYKNGFRERRSLRGVLKGHFVLTKKIKKNGDIVKCKTSMHKFIVDHSVLKICHSKVVFKPYNPQYRRKALNPNIHNYFKGFKCCWDKINYNNVNKSRIRFLLNHIREVVSGGDVKVYWFIIMWLANIVQKPWKKTDIAVTVVGGDNRKNVLTDLFINHLFGTCTSTTIDTLKSLKGRFDCVIAKKIFVILDEATVHGDYSDILYSIRITKYQQYVEERYLDPFMIPDCCNYMFFLNNVANVDLSDYRLMVVKSVDRDDEYLERFVEECCNDECVFEFVKYLLQLDIEGYNLAAEMPVTDIKKEFIRKREMKKLHERRYSNKNRFI